MKAPRCRLCGKEHWGTCPGFDADELNRAAIEKLKRSGEVLRPAKSGGDSAASVEPSSSGPEIQALSNAERQRKWRQKDPEGYRVWNRERMKRRRAGKNESGG